MPNIIKITQQSPDGSITHGSYKRKTIYVHLSASFSLKINRELFTCHHYHITCKTTYINCLWTRSVGEKASLSSYEVCSWLLCSEREETVKGLTCFEERRGRQTSPPWSHTSLVCTLLSSSESGNINSADRKSI